MEQPRFGGVALPPLSIRDDGEGKSTAESRITNTMETIRQLTTLDLQPVIPAEGRSDDVRETDSDVEEVMEVLRQLGISPQLERHKLKHERQRAMEKAKGEDDGLYCKNLLLKDRKGRAYLLLCGEDDMADLHVVKYHLGAQGNLHFASREFLWRMLHVLPGAVSPLALIHSPGDIRVFVDATLVKAIDPHVTKLYFHPLKAHLQVGLTLLQLKTFLHHCGVSLEKLPSLTQYSAKRQYNLTGGGRYRHQSEHKVTSETKDVIQQNVPSEETGADCDLQQSAGQSDEAAMDQANITHNTTQHSDLFQQLGVSVEETAATRENQKASSKRSTTILPCKSVYLKDKRDNYFLFICHMNQKVDFSSLKMQLKPRKKIMPLNKAELWSLLGLLENRENPFVLASLKHPRFLVAISDNFYYSKGGAVNLAFPHPTDPNLHLKVTLKRLETLITDSSHDLTTVQMKGSIDQLQAIGSARPAAACSPPSSEDDSLNEPDHVSPEAEGQCPLSLLQPAGESHGQLLSGSQRTVPALWPAQQGHMNMFHQLTTPLREWIWRIIRRLVRILNHYLPNQVSALLSSRSLFWNRMVASEMSSDIGRPDQDTQNREEQANGLSRELEDQKLAKRVKLQQLIKQSGIHVDLSEGLPYGRFLKDDAERCKMGLLEDDHGQPFFILCREEDNPSRRNLRRLRKALQSLRPLHMADAAGLSRHLSWPEDPSMSWAQDDLHPLALIDVNPQATQPGRQICVGMIGGLYSFPGTVLNFDLPSLGVGLRMSCDDLEEMIKNLGFWVLYLY